MIAVAWSPSSRRPRASRHAAERLRGACYPEPRHDEGRGRTGRGAPRGHPPPQLPLLRRGPPRSLRRRVRPPGARAVRNRGGAPGARDAGQPDAGGGRTGEPGLRPRPAQGSHALAGQRALRGRPARVRGASTPVAPHRSTRLRVRAEDRRAGRGPPLHARPLRARGDPRRWARGRGHHPKPPHHQGDSVRAEGRARADHLTRGAGEVFMPREAFAHLNATLEETGQAVFANPRNAAAGAVRQKDPTVTAARPLDIFLYHVSHREPGGFESHWEVLETLKTAGFPVNPRSARCTDLDAVIEYSRRLEAE